MIRLKNDSVRVSELHASCWHALYLYDSLRRANGVFADTVITSGNDGRHSYGSLHHMNRAVDARTKDVDRALVETIIKKMREMLGPDFDLIHENVGQENEHLHIESQPKQR